MRRGLPIDTQPNQDQNQIDIYKKQKQLTHQHSQTNPFEEVQLSTTQSLSVQSTTTKSISTHTKSRQMLANRNKSKTEIGQSQSTIELPSWLPPNPLNPKLFEQCNIDVQKNSYNNAKPYRHLQFQSLCTPDAMSKIQNEIIHYLPTTARETDLFKVNQSIDLNNIDLESDLAQKLPYLLSLRTHLYSTEFRSLLQNITNCAEIIDTVDCAANVYAGSHGNHLLSHDDVIGTRVLSYIIYLPLVDQNELTTAEENEEKNNNGNKQSTETIQYENNNKWCNEFGGHLELFDKLTANVLPFGTYPTAQPHIRDEHRQIDLEYYKSLHPNISQTELESLDFKQLQLNGIQLPPRDINIPLPIPSKLVSPNFNSMVVFEVKAGSSYHAVQEVYSIHSKRISIQGWFHQKIRQPDYGATLRMLQVPFLHPTQVTLPSTIQSTQQKDCHKEQINNNNDNDRNALQLVLDNKLDELTQDEMNVITANMFPSREFEFFKYINDSILETAFNKLSTSSTSTTNTDDNEGILSSQEIDYLTKIVLLHTHNVMIKQHNIHNQTQSSSATTTTTTNMNNDDSKSTPNNSNNEQSNDNDDVEVDLFTPDIIKKDLSFLRKFISKEYTSVSVLQQLQSQWEEKSVLQLGNFLKPELIQLVIKSLIRCDVIDRIALVPDFSSFLERCGNNDEDDENNDEDDMDFNFGTDEDEDDMNFDFGVDDEDDEDDNKKEQDEDDDMEFDFGVDEDDEDTTPKKSTKKVDTKKSSKSTQNDTINNADNNTQTPEIIDITNQLLDSTPLLTEYKQKQKPPSYIIGIDSISNPNNNTSNQHIGGWKLSGPGYLQRYAYFETILRRETHHLMQNRQHTTENSTTPLNYDWNAILKQFNSYSIHFKAGLILESLTKFLFGSLAFTRIIEWITSYRLLAYRSTLRRFRTGLDFSVGNYNDMIECSSHQLLQTALEITNEKLLQDSISNLNDNILTNNYQTCIIDTNTIQPNTLSMLDITLSFADNGQFDHFYGQNIWRIENNSTTIPTTSIHDDQSSIASQDEILEKVIPTVIIEKDLYLNSQKDLMMSDLTPYLDSIENQYRQQQLNDLTNSNQQQFVTIPQCDVRLKQKQNRWDSDDCGAFTAYVPVDTTTEGDDAQQYVESNGDDDELISLSLTNNTLTISKHKPNVLSFVRYVNFHAPGSRFDISLNCIYQEE